MKVERFAVVGPALIIPDVYADDRGYFLEQWSEKHFRKEGIPPTPGRFVQGNVSCSKRGVLRGLHYQAPPFAQGKLVTVLRGSVVDVAVDIRKGSPTYGKYVLVALSAENHQVFWIPEGFAHGFLALEDDTIFSYQVTDPYSRESERSLRFDDPDIGIVWPREIFPILSAKDAIAPRLRDIVPEFSFDK